MHISFAAVLYLGISPPPDFSFVPISLPTCRLANYSSRDAEDETQGNISPRKMPDSVLIIYVIVGGLHLSPTM